MKSLSGRPDLAAFAPVQLRGGGSGLAGLGPHGRLVLQRGASREEGVLQVVVEQAADGGHVDVGEARQAAGEVGGVVVRPEEAPELAVEDVLGLSSVRGDGRWGRRQHEHLLKPFFPTTA